MDFLPPFLKEKVIYYLSEEDLLKIQNQKDSLNSLFLDQIDLRIKEIQEWALDDFFSKKKDREYQYEWLYWAYRDRDLISIDIIMKAIRGELVNQKKRKKKGKGRRNWVVGPNKHKTYDRKSAKNGKGRKYYLWRFYGFYENIIEGMTDGGNEDLFDQFWKDSDECIGGQCDWLMFGAMRSNNLTIIQKIIDIDDQENILHFDYTYEWLGTSNNVEMCELFYKNFGINMDFGRIMSGAKRCNLTNIINWVNETSR